MNKEQLEALREWVKSEIEYGIMAEIKESARGERDDAKNCFDLLSDLLTSKEES